MPIQYLLTDSMPVYIDLVLSFPRLVVRVWEELTG
jgi:hypothetical protein